MSFLKRYEFLKTSSKSPESDLSSSEFDFGLGDQSNLSNTIVCRRIKFHLGLWVHLKILFVCNACLNISKVFSLVIVNML